MNGTQDSIELILPLKPEYVSVARLTASGIANRVGFDIDTIEDIKVAISEVCSKIVSIGSSVDSYTIVFKIFPDKLEVVFACEDESLRCIFRDNTDDELSLSILTALMDKLELCTDSSSCLLSMEKSI